AAQALGLAHVDDAAVLVPELVRTGGVGDGAGGGSGEHRPLILPVRTGRLVREGGSMAKLFEAIDDRLAEFINRQRVFFVATAPGRHEGHVNLSPKGVDGTFSIIDERTVAYLDIVGSGIETVAHLKNDGRIVVMFCAFEGPPRIVRLHGRGAVVLPGDPAWEGLM